MILPNPPDIKIEVLEKEELGKDGFLYVTRNKAVFTYPNGKKSAPFTADTVGRRKLNAVAIVPFKRFKSITTVYLRSAIRPALALSENEGDGNLWEIPAGLIEDNEESRETAQRELFEELGFNVPMGNIMQLGPATYPTVGICGETVEFFAANLDHIAQLPPTLDGSPMEEGGMIYELTLEEALGAIRNGEIMDSKTEIGIRRLAEL